MALDPKISINLKEFPAEQIKEEAIQLYRTFVFEAGASESKATDLVAIPPLSPQERFDYVKKRVESEHADWNKDWEGQAQFYQKLFIEGDPELYYAALDRLLDEDYLLMIHKEVNAFEEPESSELNQNPISQTINQTKKDSAKTLSQDLN